MSFDWDNTRKKQTYQIRSRKQDGDDWGEWTAPAPWLSDLDALIDSLGDTVDVDDQSTGETYITAGNTQFVIVTEWVYQGLYDNVDKLREYLRERYAEASQVEDGGIALDDLVVEAIDALSMILTHDQGERDKQAGNGYCRHGRYVGGMGIDYMCGACESGEE